MPELAEVEVARRQLVRWIGDRALDDLVVADPLAVRTTRSTSLADAHPDGAAAVAWAAGRRLDRTQRVGKRLWLGLGDRALLVHLGMSGRLVRREVGEAVPRHGRVAFVAGRTAVWLVDTRRFGCVVPLAADTPWADDLGPDALEADLDGPALAARCRARSSLKAVLMDQARLAGLGNIQVAEALFAAGLDPRASAASLTDAHWARLAEAIPAGLRHALAVTDTDDDVAYLSDGAHADNPFAVYGRDGQPCVRCGATIVRFRQHGRTTWACTACQTDPRDAGAAPR